MSLTSQNIMDRASIIIRDMTNVRWPATELLNWLNDCRRDLSVMRPDMYTVTTALTLVVGAKQTLPSGGLRLMDVPRNTNGSAVTVTQRGFLDQQNPTWTTMTGTTSVKHFMVDERYPVQFYVYPPAASGASVDIIYQAKPTDLTASSTLSDFEELYAGSMVDYICYRAFSKDAEYAGNSQRAMTHYQQYQNALQTGAVVNIGTSPNKLTVGGTSGPIGATGAQA